MADPYPYHYDAPRLRISDSEIVVQKQCLNMVARLFPNTRVAAVPNGTHIRSHAGRRKATIEGRSAGFPDLILVGSQPIWSVKWGSASFDQAEQVPQPLTAFIEVKALAPMTDEQKDWLMFLMDCGHHCGVFRSDVTLEAKMREWGFR